MCTLTFMPARGGFDLVMNRDEQRTRPAALPPERHTAGPFTAWYPREPGGGTWIGINERGLALALLNRNNRPPRDGMSSRGHLIPRLLTADSLHELEAMVAAEDLRQTNPFRIVAADPWAEELREFLWDGADSSLRCPAWQLTHWFSSSFDEHRVTASRAEVARAASRDPGAGSLPWARRLHASHEPQCGAFSICMHRDDAETVSCTEISWHAGAARVAYLPLAPCRAWRME